ncbi:MAG: heparinase II/III family protein [Thalassobaculales bacterium]
MSGAWGALQALAFSTPIYRLMLSGRTPTALTASLADYWPGDTEHGRLLVEGRVALLGHTVALAGAERWAPPGTPAVWRQMLNRFGWLRDLRELGGDAARKTARDLVDDWIGRFQDWEAEAWAPDTLAARIANWIGHYDFFCASADDAYRQRFFDSLARQCRHLARVADSARPGAGAVSVLKGLIYAGACLETGEGRLAQAEGLLVSILDGQVLPDGGHVSRSPSLHLQVLRDLIDIRTALRLSERPAVPALQQAIEAMGAMLRAWRHGDGGLALFNDSAEERATLVDAVLAQAEARGRPPVAAEFTGFQRLTAGRLVLIADCGVPSEVDGRAHAGTLSFEASVGKERLIVNCGSAPGHPEWNPALRQSAAHSTAILDDLSSSDIDAEGRIARRPQEVTARRDERDGALWLDCSHDGYLSSHTVTHRRRLYLSGAGDDLRGEDSLIGPGRGRFAIRFHLHPGVRASLAQSGNLVHLRLPGGMGWAFRCAGASLNLAESVYLGRKGNSRRSQQMVLAGELPGSAAGVVVKWALRREDRKG